MTRYTEDSRDRVKDAVDMLALVGSKVELTRKAHNSYFGLCPFHNEQTPSFHVRPDEKHYHCFGCAASGDPFTFLMELEGLDFVGAMEELASRFGVTLETVEESPEAAAERQHRERLYQLLARASAYYERYLWESAEAAPARAYLEERGLSEELLREFHVGYAPDAWDRISAASVRAGYTNQELTEAGLAQPKRSDPSRVLDRFRGRVMFPTADARGRIRGFGARIMRPSDREAKYINTAEGELYHKRNVLYGIDQARAPAAKRGQMVLCEGYTDVIAMHQANVSWCVGIMGTSLTKEQVGELARSVKTVLLCLDADSAGQQAAMRAAGVASEQGLELRVVPLPAGSDPADLLRSQGPEHLHDLVERSVPYVVFEVDQLLAAADPHDAEGKDRAITALRPVLARVPASVLRDELIRSIATRLSLTESRLDSLIGVSASSGAVPRSPDRAATATVAPSPGRARPQHERSFLAVSMACPDAGAQALARSDIEELFTDPVYRTAARHIVQFLPGAVERPQDPDLAAVVDDLQDRAGRGTGAGADEVEHARLVLENARLARELRYAREHGGSNVPALKARQQQVLGEIRAVVSRIEQPH